ncbi:MAG TPA: tol-pal system protein YbgF [Gammaproteobacteria bacterium]|nr:tol-pal system protein YbgF [Gammaproteobacteria bacterium]
MKTSLMPIAIAAAVVGSSSLSARDDPVELKLTDLEARMIRIEKIVNNQSLIELANQLDQLRSETAALRGDIEQLRHDTDGAASRQRELYVDVDKRLQSLEQAERSAALAPPQPAPAPAAPSSAPPRVPATTAPAAVTAAPKPGVSDKQAYQAAFDLLQARKYDEAAKSFTQFLSGYASSPLADNAQYWLAQSHYVQRQFNVALPEFQKVVDKYPQSSKLPDALLKVGYCQTELGNKNAARTALQQVMKQFPDTTAARLATQQLEKLSQEGG